MSNEYKRKCKQTGCKEEFVVSVPSMDEDRMLGYSEPEYCPKHRQMHAKSYSRIAVHHIDMQETPEGFELIRRMEEAKSHGKKISLGPGGIGQFEREIRPFVPSENPDRTEREFPIAEKDQEILDTLDHHQVIVLVGPTGSGKSTHVPHMLLKSKWSRRGPIVVTQPRIQATRQIPNFVAKLHNVSCGPGAAIGFTHSGSEEYDRRTRLLFMTDGKLINDIVSGRIANYSIIMIDEAHERSANIDLILGLLKDQLYLYPHLRLIIASATINERTFIDYFGGEEKVPFIESEGQFYKVEEHWWGDENDSDKEWWGHVNHGNLPDRDALPEAIADLVEYLCKKIDKTPADEKAKRDGHILVFLPGSREIDRTVSEINARELKNVLTLPLYAARPLDEQSRALDPSDPKDKKMRRVVVSTNVAETSLTVEGVKYVIDSGYIKEARWNSKLEINELVTVWHSKSGCRQRRGRAGRIEPGDAYKLYTQQQFTDDFLEDTPPDIVRSSLEQIVLTMLSAGVRNIKDFQWMPLEEKDQERFLEELNRAFDSLKQRKAIDKDGDLTAVGLELRGAPVDMDIAAIFAEGDRFAMGVEVATLLPFLKLEFGLQSILQWDKEWDTYKKWQIRKKHLELTFGCQDDLDLYFKLWILWDSISSDNRRKKWCEEYGIDYKTFKDRIEEERLKLIGRVMDWRKSEQRPVILEKIDALRALIAYCLKKEIYAPVENTASAVEDIGFLDWESYWEGADCYEEYEEGMEVDTSLLDQGQSGVFHRLYSKQGEEADSLIEISPVSVCYGKPDLNRFVACQRRANYLRPANAKILGLNLVRIDPAWDSIHDQDAIQRALFLADLSRHHDKEDHQNKKISLFLPWIFPIGSMVKGKFVENSQRHPQNLILIFLINNQAQFPIGFESDEIRVECAFAEPAPEQTLFEPGDEVRFFVAGFAEDDYTHTPILLVSQRLVQENCFANFAKLHKKGKSIDVVMHQILPDPLERNPLFVVKEPRSDLEIPMSGEDFCGHTRFRPYFGTRFAIGETFRVDIEDRLDVYEEEVHLSRLQYLLNEYEQVPKDKDRKVIKNLRVQRVDNSGVYLLICGTGSPYVSFTRHALWPPGFNPRPGEKVEGRIRRYERNIDIGKIRQKLEEGEKLPSELDLGIEVDLRIPKAYEKFTNLYQRGSFLPAVVIERQLPGGGLLIDLGDGLKGMVYENHLGLDENGNLKKARDYDPGDKISVRVVDLKDDSARVNCSIFCMKGVPSDLKDGETIDVKVLHMRKSGDTNYITASFEDQYFVSIRNQDEKMKLKVGDMVEVKITKRHGDVGYLEAVIVL